MRTNAKTKNTKTAPKTLVCYFPKNGCETLSRVLCPSHRDAAFRFAPAAFACGEERPATECGMCLMLTGAGHPELAGKGAVSSFAPAVRS